MVHSHSSLLRKGWKERESDIYDAYDTGNKRAIQIAGHQSIPDRSDASAQ